MKILRMQATFGKLENETLELREGLNILTLPNEAGKSTWCAFILAMLYGVDTSERTTKTVLPDKTRYAPWSGRAMEGRMELEHGGRRITLERSGSRKAPMSVFRAYDSLTGRTIAGLSAENCGQTLLGVPKSVFERSAFVRQSGLAVSADAALEARLTALVTSGEEGVSYQQTEKRLNDAKNRLRHNRTGLIPQTQAQLSEVEQALESVRSLRARELPIRARMQALQLRQQALDAELAERRAQENERRSNRRRQAQQDVQDAQTRFSEAQRQLSELPPRTALSELRRQLDALETPQQTEPLPLPEPPACPDVFIGVPEQDILERARRDGLEFDRLTSAQHRPAALYFLLCALTALAAIACAFVKPILCVPFALCAVLLAALGVFSLRHNRLRETQLSGAQRLLSAYGNRSRDEFALFAAEYQKALLLWKQQCALVREKNEAGAQRLAQYREKKERILGSVGMFSAADDLAQAREAVNAALELYARSEQAGQSVQLARSREEALGAALAETDILSIPEESWPEGAAFRSEYAANEQELRELENRLERSRGQAESFGELACLQAKKEELSEKLSVLQQRYDAVELSRQALAAANEQISTRFSPRLAALAGEIFSDLTQGRYERVVLGQDMELSAAQTDAAVLHPLRTLSCGTADQLYLSVRLAVCRLILGEDAFIVLDDALTDFDDERLRTALTFLKKESGSRQVILFTCQSREERTAAQL